MPACGRCTKAGQAPDCLYIDDATDNLPDGATGRGSFDGHISRPIQQTAAPMGDTLSRLEYQDRRIKQLEAALANTGHTQITDAVQRMKVSKLPLTPESGMAAAEQMGATVTDRETMLLRGKSFKTQFHGSTHPSSLIAHIPDLNTFTKEAFERFPALARIRHDMHVLEDRVEYAGSKSQFVSESDLKALLPQKADVDQLVQLYLNNYGSIYHVLHLPTFWKQYHGLWSDLAGTSAHFVATVLLMIASAQCLMSTQPWLYTANSSLAREKAITYIQACDDWLQTQSQKHVTSADFQIRFLLVFARQVSARKVKRTWTEAGTLLRFCMAAGLHRNPDLLRKKTSALDKDLRRRIWAAAVELELQASFDRGMMAAPWPMQADCPPPSNIHDEDVDQDTEQMPPSVRPDESTRSSYLWAASESTMLRHGLNTTLNNIRQTLGFDDVKRFTEEIDAQIQAIPKWTGTGADVAAALLSLNLRQYVLVLHDRQLRQAETAPERSFSRVMIIENATRTIDTHRALIEKGSHALELLCQDQLRAALSICHLSATVDIRADSAIGQIIEHHAGRVMDEAVQMLTDKVSRLGVEQRRLWIALAAHGFWKANNDPSQRAVYMQEAVDKVTRPYYKIMACQDEMPTGVGAPVEKLASREELPNGTLEHLPPLPQTKAGGMTSFEDLPILDLDEIEAWTLENWNQFNATDLQSLTEPYQPNPT
ncbi:hypothetical protein B0A55_05499 [Friedmanniomyces simplex]|uniref:Xylanolytic transcriptional activator regulatory domain-containing protein n=1 Tax=Friedmanniomyces simplex TaxID=329884 RepID=A0A4U0XA22_9PEZI|nr:hypothetical protein B0A55_05499 [Friedmanniomyces simplex]